ncbi:MAG: hypothetical protein ACR2NV_12890, partial [Thermoleophilaceae bacterium]
MNPPPRSTGLPRADAQDDFLRVRRRRALGRVVARLRGQPADVGLILPFEEMVEALGRTGECSLGLGVVALDTIVGTSTAAATSTGPSVRRPAGCAGAGRGSRPRRDPRRQRRKPRSPPRAEGTS